MDGFNTAYRERRSIFPMTAEEAKKILGLIPHPREGGCYIRAYESGEMLPPMAFADGRYPSARHTATAIYYLLEPDTFSEMHRLKSDEVFHFYAGDAVEMLQLMEDGSGRTVVIGNDLAAGERPQVVVEREVWQGSRLVKGGRWALSNGWPEFAEMIAALTRG